MNKSIALWCVVFICGTCGSTFGQVPAPIHGVTVDNVGNLSGIATSLTNLTVSPTTRIVYDRGLNALDYFPATQKISTVSYVMGLPVDSSDMGCYTAEEHQNRFEDYVSNLGDLVNIWEVGNEINGNWLYGDTSDTARKALGLDPCAPPASVGFTSQADVVAKMTQAYYYVKGKTRTTELTLFYFPPNAPAGCAQPDPEHEMLTWATNNIPSDMKNGLDYVMVSYYEDDTCAGYRPSTAEWDSIFQQLRTIFPNSMLGFGEVGSAHPNQVNYQTKVDRINFYYGLHPNVTNYVGGYFWWNFAEDMVPYVACPPDGPSPDSLWCVLGRAMQNQ